MSLAEPQIRLATAVDTGAVSTLLNDFRHTNLLTPTAEEAAAFFATISEPATAARSRCTRASMRCRYISASASR
ncbi:MAG: hypothetical protein ACYCT1_00500 [Steroidobacteraceae bacterium]